MPELPEVETMVRGIRPHVVGRRVADVVRPRCRRKPILIQPGFRQLRSRTRGCVITTVERLAKRVLLKFDSGDVMAIEPRMTGLVLLADPPTKEHLRLEWLLNGKGDYESLWFWDRRGLGTVRLYDPQQFASRLGPDVIGPDALTCSLDEWEERCGRTQRAIKVALLDQKWIAGVGNLYASEILHVARIHPERCAGDLSRNQIRKLREATQTVLATAIRYEGSTLSDGTYRNALNRNGRYQNEHRVYAREGQRCPACRRGTIRRFVQAQRSTFCCPICQRAPRR
ncbi:MAG: bifunctional DNA-formamidopyrimidine glycosylase/DNA-(apurinic or apyrimidinic site) lyase [Planctomycetota bacterium]|nr:MAG: bifunctional DNA-formamidopyrimidine glycosylase/DNA-(apurinic or apyrimidinic site) lyase [Planctomycetota bacterium]REJ93054.1 MAG: bifunctional DNA-formamidopyrimidine glycosylase/DNA-(apurinic or apyrimidinic site) lyase [Planctomycetota bacterium]REK30042.1 MAG: bifunctional DNA-formamidopyrimidine glycosylase/DNA-(apurinic or apyrimidinic site) lyase [Planctomycetota bacterium]REK37716.1 MAG: bifunctional DNA-formamidopyrimidine glycosylase/DNA-(apurinic or apyrimidinic site) lyase